MSLYIRVQNSFWTHRKTIRLKARLGDAAMWIPPRLWSYAADNQPDGDFSNYSPEEIALLIGCSLEASSMLQALQDVGFMDGMQIHDWHEHNGYHEKFAARAKIAAEARWAANEKKGKERKRKETSIASSNATSINGDSEESKPKTPKARNYLPITETLWPMFPKIAQERSSKKQLEKELKAAEPRPEDSRLIESLAQWCDSEEWNKDGGKFIPGAHRWASGSKWDIEPTPQQQQHSKCW